MAWRGACLALVLAILSTGMTEAADGSPAAVSPGSVEGFSSISGRCPTFSWGQVKEARSYELVVYRVASGKDLAYGSGEPPAINQQFPGTAQSWTPALGQCLATGGSYAWSIRAVTTDAATPWSNASLFRISAAPSMAEVEEALGVLRVYMADGSDRSGGAAAQNSSRARPRPSESGDTEDVADSAEAATKRGELEREMVAERQRQIEARPKPLYSETLGIEGAPSVRTVIPPASYSLVLDGDVALGGNVFKEGLPFLHTDGGPTFNNTALGLNALVSTTPGYPYPEYGKANTAIGRNALSNNDWGHSNTASGAFALYFNTKGKRNTATGVSALASNITGSRNTATGYGALASNTGGSGNTAGGDRALLANTNGIWNTAVGSRALYSNTSGESNTALGERSLYRNTSARWNTGIGADTLVLNTGEANTAVGFSALFGNTSGSHNIGIGRSAGVFADTGSDNIFIGNRGVAGDSNIIRIGNAADHQIASIAGDVGLGTESPTNRLHVQDSINLGALPTNHVELVENTSTGNSPDVLALKVGTPAASVGTAHNFITFFSGENAGLGAIQGNGSGGIELAGPGNDYAEWLQRVDPDEVIEAGEVVGLFGDRVSKNTEGADGVMVTSSAAIVAGNDPGEGNRGNYVLVAFVGQADVTVHGPVEKGDYLVASGRGDGKAVAVAPESLDPGTIGWIVGRAMADKGSGEEKAIRTLVGVADLRPLSAVLARQSQVIEAQRQELGRQANELARQRTEMANLREWVTSMPTREAKR